MITISYSADELRPLRLGLCCFAPPSSASQAERLQAKLALRFMQQQLAALGAEVALLPPGSAGGDGIEALVVFPAFCASPSALAAVLDSLDRPCLVMAVSTGAEGSGEPGWPQGAPQGDGTGMGRKWIGGGLFDVRAWYEAGQWLAALSTSHAVARGQFASAGEAALA